MDLTNQFLIAMPTLRDPNFYRTVTYLCAHNEDGAMGIIINRPLSLRLGDVLKHMEIEVTDPVVKHLRVFQGGPVQPERGFVIHRPSGKWDAVLPVGDDIAVATSRDILNALAKGEGPSDVVVALGYAGWGAGQLEKELAENTWLSGPIDARIIFDVSYEERWQSATQLLGIDPNLLSGEAGHG
ncbi:MAG: putative transcriptional regulator [Candidatus Kentron sp. G]|nr:MAG: putative transcriptional regulator [Candidatus Kentron sp. G]VFN04296.1 MAG: putative transcriptional regulator [Candidatus Kentron sp. G]VFN05891.1 MAG: putative transcriptional regulator [Candidatus Kentron sp. G]